MKKAETEKRFVLSQRAHQKISEMVSCWLVWTFDWGGGRTKRKGDLQLLSWKELLYMCMHVCVLFMSSSLCGW